MVDQATTLPVTDPAATGTTSEQEEQSNSCCCGIVARHSIREAAESRWAPWWLLFVTRMLSGVGLVVLDVVSIVTLLGNIYHYIVFAFSAFTYLALAVCTALNGVGARAARNTTLPTAVVFLHFIAASFGILLIVDFVSIMASGYGFHPVTLILLVPLFAYLLDILVMQARIRFRYRYAAFFLVLSVIHMIIVVSLFFAYSPQPVQNPGRLIGIAIGVIVGLSVIASLIAIALTRIPWPCFKERQ